MTKGKIFLAEQRGVTETEHVMHYSTFNFRTYFNEHKQPFGALKLLNEELLAGSGKAEFELDEQTHVVIVPVTGDLYFSSDMMSGPVNVEEMQICSLPAGSTYRIINPYPANKINYLHLQFKANLQDPFRNLLKFNLHNDKNSLRELIEESLGSVLQYTLSIGLFDGRKEIDYLLKYKGSHIFAFAVAGAFELEGRLLQPGDGVGLWELESFELEALSTHAILMVIELFKRNVKE